ncbi:MAG: orotate phosphoribosyltransferase [Bacteroidales bacterium]
MRTNRTIAELLLQSKAIILEPASPFTWASGWKSPIYCDNRKTLSYPVIRGAIRDAYIACIRENFDNPDVIAGIATGAIAQGALVADAMDLPFIYVRSSAKDHGMQNLVEGSYSVGHKVLVIEDLISTGGSSLRAIEALRSVGCVVTGMVATFTYGFDVAESSFAASGVTVKTLTDYESMLSQAVESGYLSSAQLPLLQKWRKDPSNWTAE